MYKNSKQKVEEIKKLYEEGMLLNDISIATSSSTITVKKVLLSIGIDYTLEKQKEYLERLAKVIPLYNQGKSQLELEKELNLTRKTIRAILKESGCNYRDKVAAQRNNRKTEIDDVAFDELTEDALYWIGFLYADGYISNKENSIEIGLGIKDLGHLEKLKYFLKSNANIKIYRKEGRERCVLKVYSKRIQERLKYFGFDNNKSFSAKPHEELKDSRDFWRGIIDGDGGIYPQSIFLCGTLQTILDFISFVSKNINTENTKHPSQASGKSHYQVQYYKERGEIASLLYENSKTFLDRKYEKYLEIKNNKDLEI